MGFPSSQVMANHVENLSPDFIKGVDISMLCEIEVNGGR